MVKVETIRDDNEKRILKCQEGNRIWYQIWITQLDMNCIERYFDGYGEVKRGVVKESSTVLCFLL